MRVLFVLHSSSLEYGATKSCISLMLGLRKYGITVGAVIPTADGVMHLLNAEGIDTFPITYKHCVYPERFDSYKDYILFIPRLLGRLWLNRKALKAVSTFAKRWHPDIIHTNTSVIDVGVQTARKLGIPHIFHIREYVESDFNYHFYPSRNRFKSFLALPNNYSICITKGIRTYNGLDDNPRSRVIYNGIPNTHYDIKNCNKGGYYLYVGRLEPAKGTDDLIDAYKEYVSGDTAPYPLYLVGNSTSEKYEKDIRKRVNDYGLTKMVEFWGGRKEIQEFYLNARAVIIPSRHEGFGRVMPEAMFCGCLVIAHNTGGLKEQLENGRIVTGRNIAFEYNTKEELVNILTHLGSDEEQLNQYRKDAYQTVNTLYSEEVYVNHVKDYYEEILNRIK